MRVAFATCAAMPDGGPDDRHAAELLDATFETWDDASVDWHAYDRVVLRSVWDYSWRLDDFLTWCGEVGPETLRNPPDLVAFNADKRYLAELGAPTVPTTFLAPGEQPAQTAAGEIVVKPNISAGARDTGRFASPAEARPLIERIHASGRTALVQPYLGAVDDRGETSLVFVGGLVSHTLNKRAVLRARGEAPLADHPLRAAAAMFEEDLVVAAPASRAHHELAERVHAQIESGFGTPLYARIDIVEGPEGDPLVSELEVIEPNLYLATAPGAAERFAVAARAS